MADAPSPPEPLAPAPDTPEAAPPAAAPPAPAPQPQRAQVSQAPDAKARRIQNATTFLRNPQVRASPMSRRVNFLKGKGLSVDEIVEAFGLVGDPQTKDAIQGLVDGSAAPARPAAAAAPAAPAPVAVAPAPLQQPQYAAAPLPPPPPPKKEGWSWQDIYISGTMAAGGLYAASRLLTHFVDIDIRKKGSAPPRPTRRTRPAPVPRGGISGMSDDADDALSGLHARSMTSPSLPLINSGKSSAPTADAGEVTRLSRLIEEKSAELAERLTALEGKIETCEPEKLGELKKQMSSMLNEAAANKSNLEKRLAKLHHIDRLPHMQTRIAGVEEGQRRLDEIVEDLRKKANPEAAEPPAPSTEPPAPEVTLGQQPEGAPVPASPSQPSQPAAPPIDPQSETPAVPAEESAAPAVFGLQEAPAATGIPPASTPGAN